MASDEKKPTAEDVLREFVKDINDSGGLTKDAGTEYEKPSGRPAPNAAPEWTDLAVTYLHACRVLGVEPAYSEDFEDEDDPGDNDTFL